jgi:hypothetical protein
LFKDDAVRQAYQEVSGRAMLKPNYDKAMAVVEQYGF